MDVQPNLQLPLNQHLLQIDALHVVDQTLPILLSLIVVTTEKEISSAAQTDQKNQIAH
jgi:hypothetical protein